MKTYDLQESEAAGNSDPLNVRHRVNGKRVDRAAFDAIKRDPRATLDTFQTVREAGIVHFYCIARLPDVAESDSLPDDSDPQDSRTHSLAARESHASAQDDTPRADSAEDLS